MRKSTGNNRRVNITLIRFLIGIVFFTEVLIHMPHKVHAFNVRFSEYEVEVETGFLALRTAKKYDDKNIIAKLYNGDIVISCPSENDDSDYIYVYSPKHKMHGYVNCHYLNYNTIRSFDYRYVKVETGYLALRSKKAYDKSNEIGKLYTGEMVYILDNSDSEYWIVYAPSLSRTGYVNRNYLHTSSTVPQYSESDIPVIIPENSHGEWNYDNSYPQYLNMRLEVLNTSRTKTVTDFELIFYAVDVWGSKIYGESTVYTYTTHRTVAPGATVKSDYISLPDRSRISRVYVAVRKVRFSDGTICRYDYVPDSDFAFWDIVYNK